MTFYVVEPLFSTLFFWSKLTLGNKLISMKLCKLDEVAPLITDPPPTSSSTFFFLFFHIFYIIFSYFSLYFILVFLFVFLQKNYRWYVTPDMWHVTCDMWHLTHAMWHLTHDMSWWQTGVGDHCVKISGP